MRLGIALGGEYIKWKCLVKVLFSFELSVCLMAEAWGRVFVVYQACQLSFREVN